MKTTEFWTVGTRVIARVELGGAACYIGDNLINDNCMVPKGSEGTVIAVADRYHDEITVNFEWMGFGLKFNSHAYINIEDREMVREAVVEQN